jgi:flagellar hook assembly protein FlgD
MNCPACDADGGRPTTSLGTNYPNPSNPSTTISFSVAEPTRVWLTIYDVDGRRVQVLVDEEMGSGPHVARWDGRNAGGQRVGAGIYFAVLKTQARQLVRKLVLVQ